MTKIKIITLMLAFLILNSCEKNINVTLKPYQSQLAVECILQPNHVPTLHLGKSVAFFDSLTKNLDLFVNDALVTISSVNGIDTLHTVSKYNYYQCREEFFYQGRIPVLQGQSYHLKIEYNGNVYEADTEMNIDAVQIDSISYIAAFSDLYGEHEGVVVSFRDLPNEKNYYRYRMDRTLQSSNTDIPNCANGPYFASEIGRSVFFDKNTDGAPLTIVIEPAFQHQVGDTALVFLETLDAASARFFDDLDRQKSAKVNPFIEPVFINSNIAGAFGIFGASNDSRPIRFTYPE